MRKQITLTSAELLALKATPVELLPAPGEGKYYVVFHAVADYKFGTTPYTNDGPDSLDIAQGENGLIQFNDNELLESPSTSRLYMKAAQSLGGPANTFASVDGPGTQNQPLTIANLGATEITGGDGVLTVFVYYKIEDVVA